MNTEQAQTIVNLLRIEGITVNGGLQKDQLRMIEDAFRTKVPEDFATFLQAGVPVGADFPDWQGDANEVARQSLEYIDKMFEFDIKENNYWHESFGRKPNNTGSAVVQALNVIHDWPALLPIYGHRYLPTYPRAPGNPVLSVWQAVDSIYYGANLYDYFIKEFSLDLKPSGAEPARVPYWGPAFGLD